jgi:GAF domain-containing protein
MIQNLVRILFSVQYDYDSPVKQRRATGLMRLLLASTAGWAVAIIALVVPDILTEGTVTFPELIFIAVPPTLFYADFRLVQGGRLTLASLLLVTILLPFAFFTISDYGVNSSALFTAAVPLIATGLLLDRRWLALAALVVAVSIGTLSLTEYQSFDPLTEGGFATASLAFAMILAFLFLFSGSSEQIVEENYKALQRLRIVSEFPAKAFHRDEIAVYTDVITLLREQLGYDFSQVFFVDDEGRLTRQMRIGLGLEQKVIQSTVSVDDTSVLVEAVRTQHPVPVTMEDNRLRRGHFLASIRFGVAVPIIIDNRAVAVLDIQNTATRFSQRDLSLLDTLGNIVAGLVVEARMVRGLQERASEYETTTEALRNQIRELKRSGRQIVSGDWGTYLEQRRAEAIGFDADVKGHAITPAYDLPDDLRQAMKDGQPHIQIKDDDQIITVPIMLQDEMLGAMAFSIPKERHIAEKDIEAAGNIARRLAIALDNKRLYEQSRTQATREQKAGEIAGLLISATDVESVLSLAADSFNEALGAVSTRIHLEPDAVGETTRPTDRRGILT